MSDYRDFIASKSRVHRRDGVDISVNWLAKRCPSAFAWQLRTVSQLLAFGCGAIFAGCGLGKTLMQLLWADAIRHATATSVVVHCPLGVRSQTVREAAKFGIGNVVAVNDPGEIPDQPTIVVVNYEKAEAFREVDFAGVVLDESSILKSFTGATKRMLIERYAETPYRLCCTATPAPNDHMELGNHAEFLSVMRSNEMLSRWFINDTMQAGGYRLRGHAQRDFWRWVTTWAVCISKPSDVGGSDEGYDLPPLEIHRHFVDADPTEEMGNGQLFDTAGISATNLHAIKRRTLDARCQRA
ncbi:MAG: SNF2-related protein, partial [Planctomycetota bacterium]